MAVETQRGTRRDWAIPPGEILDEALSERGWTQAELARRTNRPLKTINEIVRGKAAITPETALQFELVLGIPAHVWLNLERAHGEWQARLTEEERLKDTTDWVKRFPVGDLEKYGVLEKSRSPAETAVRLLRFFQVANESAWERHWSAAPVLLRRSRSLKPRMEPLTAWLRWGEIAAERIECGPFDADLLRQNLEVIRSLSTLDPLAFESRLRTILRSAGIAFVLLPELSGTRVSGAARWLTPDRALIQMSLRHKRDDQFWYSLFHELGHLVTGSRRTTYVDVEPELDDGPDDETSADTFAANSLIPRAEYERFIQEKRFDKNSIEEFASEIGLASGVVVGRLQHDNLVPASKLNYLKRPIRFSH
jgi:HTH-type transcriptional regulator / antitoxin HigA